MTLKEEYLNLAPTCGLKKPSNVNTSYEDISFIYVKHFYSYQPLVNKIESLTNHEQNEKPKNIEDYLESTDKKLPQLRTPTVKSYIMDTFSSL